MNDYDIHLAEFLYLQSRYCFSRVLSLTCGRGESEFCIAERGIEIVGLDNDFGKLKDAGDKLKNGKYQKLSFVCVNILDSIPFQSSSFDALYWRFGLHYFSEEQMVSIIIPEIDRVLVHGSIITVFLRTIKPEYINNEQFDVVVEDKYRMHIKEKDTGVLQYRYMWNEEAVNRLFDRRFTILDSEARIEAIPDRFTSHSNSSVVSVVVQKK